PRPDELTRTTAHPDDPWALTRWRLESRNAAAGWHVPIFDLSTGRATRDVRSFATHMLSGPDTGLVTESTRIRFGVPDTNQSVKEARLSRDEILERTRRAGVAQPKMEIRGKIIDIEWNLTIGDCFRVRAANDEFGMDFDLDCLAEFIGIQGEEDY